MWRPEAGGVGFEGVEGVGDGCGAEEGDGVDGRGGGAACGRGRGRGRGGGKVLVVGGEGDVVWWVPVFGGDAEDKGRGGEEGVDEGGYGAAAGDG